MRSFLYVCHGSLNHNGSSVADPLKTPLNWRMRLQIAAGVAAALVSSLTLTILSLNMSKVPRTSCMHLHTQKTLTTKGLKHP